MGLNDFIEEIIACLESGLLDKDLAKIDVQSFPDDPSKFDLISENPTVLIRYGGTDFGDNQLTSDTMQDGRHTFVMSIVTRSLMGDIGLYTTIDRVKRAVFGKSFGGSDPSRFKEIRFAGRVGDRWQYDLSFSFVVPEVYLEPQADYPLMKHIAYRRKQDEI